MDNKSILESNASECSNNDNGIYAKLRRLKIQEEILTAAANKSSRKCNSDDCGSSRYAEELDLRKYIVNIKKTYAEIKNLFEDIKVITKDQENLKNTDIDEIKRDIFDLDEKIKSLKDFIHKEISLLKVAEKELCAQIRQNHYNPTYKAFITRAHPKPLFNEVVPSPVRAIIKTPFKCVEVQRFQEFLKNSRNRYGGWDEYNHNIFVSIWNKYFHANEILQNASVFEDTSYAMFQDEVVQKIFGIKPEDIKSHAEWYFEYIHLKNCQEFALKKWRENKRKIKKPKLIAKEENAQLRKYVNKPINKLWKRINPNSKSHEGRNDDQVAELSDMEELFRDISLRDDEVLDVKFIIDNEKEGSGFKRKCLSKENAVISTLDKPTTCIKSFQVDNIHRANNTCLSVDSIKKLKTPTWRGDLK